MAGVYPVPTTRTSSILAQTRLTAQLQADQLSILRLQSQISTGRRIALPSEDAPASQRAIHLQQLLELKAQALVNLDTSQSYLDATDSAIANVSSTLNQIRSTALGVANTTSSETTRAAAAAEVSRAIEQLVDVANQNFRGRYLFAGSKTTTVPFTYDGTNVIYNGNERELSSYADIDLLLETSIAGSQIFGAFSSSSQTVSDLQPILTRSTKLSDLRSGEGIGDGSIAISDGNSTRIINLSGASTIGDVADLIEANPPAGRTVTARVGPEGLILDIDDAGGGNFTIREVGGGTTAARLGIYEPLGTLTGPVTGEDLDPILTRTTSLADILGVRAQAIVQSSGPNNDIVIESLTRGSASNGVSLQLVDDSALHASPGLVAGAEQVVYSETAVAARAALSFSGFGNNLLLTGSVTGTSLNNVTIEVVSGGAIGDAATATFDANSKTLTIAVDSAGNTSIQSVVDAIALEGTFTASHDSSDGVDGAYNPLSTVSVGDIGVVTGNTSASGGEAGTIFVYVEAGATTANQVVTALEANSDVTARFRVSLDDSDTSSPGAAGKGNVLPGASATTINGSGSDLDLTSGIIIENGGESFTIDLSGAETIEDLLNVLNGSPAHVRAEVDPTGKGIIVRSRLSGRPISIGENGGTTAAQLGIRTTTEEIYLTELNYGRGVGTFEGTDFTITRPDGVALDIDIDGAVTVGDVIDRINNHALNTGSGRVTAALNRVGNGIELTASQSSSPGTLSITKAFQSEAAWDLGLLPTGEQSITTSTAATVASARLDFAGANSDLLVTAGIAGSSLSGVAIRFVDTAVGDVATATYDAGTRELTIALDASATSATTIRDAINLEGTFSAALDATSDPTNDGSGVIGTTGVVGTTSGGTAEVLTGANTYHQEVQGVFNTLIQLRDAINNFDLASIDRSLESLDVDLDRINFGRAEIGARGQALDLLRTRLEDEEVTLKDSLSKEIEVDITQAISELAARQASLEASMQLMATLFQTTLLNYL